LREFTLVAAWDQEKLFSQTRCFLESKISASFFEIYGRKRVVGREGWPIFGCVFTDDAKAFYHQQPESVRKSYKELSGALKERYCIRVVFHY
jgi:hypothetical protein